VQEGQQFRFGEITASSDLPEIDVAAFLDVNKIKTGKIYSPARVENTITRMERLAIQQGLDFIRVEPRINRNDADMTLDVEFSITRGPRVFVERIDIEGNATTLDRVIRRQFNTVEGDPFNPREIRDAAERIRHAWFRGQLWYGKRGWFQRQFLGAELSGTGAELCVRLGFGVRHAKHFFVFL